jgi:hypothetical protein
MKVTLTSCCDQPSETTTRTAITLSQFDRTKQHQMRQIDRKIKIKIKLTSCSDQPSERDRAG